MHDFAINIRNLDADRRFAGDRRKDTHVGTRHRIGDIALEIGDLFDLDTRSELNLVLGDGRPAQEADDFRVYLKLLERVGQRADDIVVRRGAHRMRLAFDEHAEIWQLIGPALVGLGGRLVTRLPGALVSLSFGRPVCPGSFRIGGTSGLSAVALRIALRDSGPRVVPHRHTRGGHDGRNYWHLGMVVDRL